MKTQRDWWEIEDHGGWPPFSPPPRVDGLVLETSAPWPTEWNRRPHP